VFGQANVLAAGQAAFPPSVEDFFLPSILPWGAHDSTGSRRSPRWSDRRRRLIIYFRPVPEAEAGADARSSGSPSPIYGFVRNNIAVDMIGLEGVRFAPYFATLFSFILLTNLFGIIPFVQISPNTHIAFPIILAVISYVMFNYIGIRRHGFVKYFKTALIPPAPWFILPLLIPIEFFSTFIVRPFSLAVRLFANMFAGHMLLLVFTLGGFAMLNANAWLAPVSVLSWVMTVALTFLEFLVIVLQAYVFTVLTASYVQGALADEH
jgi:F-type H+-transporting ATPase subunit a